ncbi:MAG: YcjX family protein [Alphaproteobacteria bacterium]|nr:YcjX family protein [Alphaproteobacteria bacterium]
MIRRDDIFSTTWKALEAGGSRLGHALLDRRLRLGITGLRGAGKTVFCTALIELITGGRDWDERFPLLSRERRPIAGRVLPVPGWKPFPIEEMRAGLQAATPDWPPPTAEPTATRIEFDIPADGLWRRLGISGRRIDIEIVDYPGEWLLDLALLKADFASWSRETLRLIDLSPTRAALSRDWRAEVAAVDLSAHLPDDALYSLHRGYVEFLRRCRFSDPPLYLLAPGQFIRPPADIRAETDFHFFPASPADERKAGRGSALAELEARYQRYRRRVREFYERSFQGIDAQVVLVDVLEALNQGPESFADLQRALRLCMESFDYGPSNPILRWFRPSVARIAFAATKADQVTRNQWNNHRLLLEKLLSEQVRRARAGRVEIEFFSVASVRGTREVKRMFRDRPISMLQGRKKGAPEDIIEIYPGEVPADLPGPDYWQRPHRFVDFLPWRDGDAAGEAAAPAEQIGLDELLDFLLRK